MGAAHTLRAGLVAPPPEAAHTRMWSQAWPISAEEFREVLRSLSFEYFKWDMHLGGTCRILPESIVLSRGTHDHLVGITESFSALMRRFEANVRHDPALIEELGVDPGLVRILAAESEHEPAFSRADFFLTPDGRWVLSEFNEDVPGGFNEAVGINEILGDSELGGCGAGDLRAALGRAFGQCHGVGLIYATAFSEDLQHCAVLEKWLRESGYETVRASPEHLRYRRSGVRLAGSPVEGIFRFYPGEWMGLLSNTKDWIKALPALRMMNPPARLLSQSKKSFGVWQSSRVLDSVDRTLADRYCPRTAPFDPAQTEHYRQKREDLVLKRAFGRMGDAVEVGALNSPADWEAAIKFASSRPREFAVQERFLVQPMAFAGGLLYPTIGVYTVNGRFAGYYSRVAPQPFITHEAFYVATVLEAA